MTLTLVIADDEELAREKLRTLAEDLPDVRVVGEAEDGPTALRLIDELRPDVVLLDLSMPGMSGLTTDASKPRSIARGSAPTLPRISPRASG